jgi:hypothetical protein
VIAQEIANLFPELVSFPEGSYASVDYSGLTVVLLEAVKEQNRTIRELEAQVAEMQETLDRLIIEQP